MPEGYFPPEECACGPQNYLDNLIPDALWGLSIREACCIHDYMYLVGETQADKDIADRVFLENMLLLIEESKPSRLMRWLRRRSAWTYYQAVHRFGGLVYWNRDRMRRAILSAG
jgi:hypothetical protein